MILMVTGSGFGAFRLPQNFGIGQKDSPDRYIRRPGEADGIGDKTIGKLAHQFLGVYLLTIIAKYHGPTSAAALRRDAVRPSSRGAPRG
jgi:hypothetical protein